MPPGSAPPSDHGLVCPLTTQAQPGNPWAVPVARNPTPGEVWAVCNHPYPGSCLRLTATHGAVPRLTVAGFRPIHELVLKRVPSLEGVDVSA